MTIAALYRRKLEVKIEAENKLWKEFADCCVFCGSIVGVIGGACSKCARLCRLQVLMRSDVEQDFVRVSIGIDYAVDRGLSVQELGALYAAAWNKAAKKEL